MSKWTTEQFAAITARNCNLLVAAAAGAGKTAVLVERLLRRITDPTAPVDIDRLLVVTFTKAAAAEMRGRIGLALSREMERHPESRHLRRQSALLNRAEITTLHSFCLNVVKEYFYRLDLDPGFRVADETEAALLRQEALEGLIEDEYSTGDQEFLRLVEAYGGERDDSQLQEIILKLDEFASGSPWPDWWLNQAAAAYRLPQDTLIDDLPWTQAVLGWVRLQLESVRVRLERAVRLAETPGGPTVYAVTLNEDRAAVAELLAASRSWSSLELAFDGVVFSRLKACRAKDIDDQLKERVKKTRDEVKKKVEAIGTEYFGRPAAELMADLRQMAPMVEYLSRLAQRFAQRYRDLKAAKSLVDFGDLEHFCLEILRDSDSRPGILLPSPVALEFRERFAEVLVDEYQDINAVQESILQLVSRQALQGQVNMADQADQADQADRRPNLFMVGDVKQSIYRFRQAEPRLFLEKYREYPSIAESDDSLNRRIDLAKNFRSRPEVVDAVNFLFRQLMTPAVGEMAYDEKAELVCGADYGSDESETSASGPHSAGPSASGPVELHILEKRLIGCAESGSLENGPESGRGEGPAGTGQDSRTNTGEESPEAVSEAPDIEELDAAQREARLVAVRIRQIVESGCRIFDKELGCHRRVSFRDIVILMRATRGLANTYVEEFRQVGIPAYADLATGYFAAPEVETMLSLLTVIDNPKQDIPLAAVLRSPMVGLNAEELAQVRLIYPNGDYYEAVRHTSHGTSALAAKLREFLQTLEEWRTMARQGPLAELIWRLFAQTGYYAYVGAMPGGAQRQANLRALYDRARQYEATSFRGLFRFLRFLEKFRAGGSDLGTARALGENEDVVRIMSIHKSKGLEFPVVFVTGMGKQFNQMDLRSAALLHKELGLGLPVVDPDIRLTYPSLAQTALKKRLQAEALAEELRILYVALTRAREKLIMVGSVNDLEKCVIRWCEQVEHLPWNLPDADLASAKTFLDWVAPAVARHPHGKALRRMGAGGEVPDGEVSRDRSCWQVFCHWPDAAGSADTTPFENVNSVAYAASTQDTAGKSVGTGGTGAAGKTATAGGTATAGDTAAAGGTATAGDTAAAGGTAATTVPNLAEILAQVETLSPLSLKTGVPAGRAGADSAITDILEWQYPYAAATAKPAKAAVTELKRRFAGLEEDFEPEPPDPTSTRTHRTKLPARPRFLQETGSLSASEKGSAMHLVMQHLDLHGDLTIVGIQEQVARLEMREILTPEQTESIDAAAIAGFIQSPLGRKAAACPDRVRRELPFTIALPAYQVYPDLGPENYDPVVVQGVIDCLIEEEDGLIIVDFKTDRIWEGGTSHLAEAYRGQVNLYALAVESILKRPVKAKYLYLFANAALIDC